MKDEGTQAGSPESARLSRVLVVGSGAMGSQIAMVCALAGFDVAVHDISDAQLESAKSQLSNRMSRRVEKGQLTAEESDAAFARLRFGTDLAAAAVGADIVIEAAVEKLDIKRKLFAEVEAATPESAILASNSSSFVPSSIASATRLPSRVLNIHFFNPALVMRCVEVVPGSETSPEVLAAAVRFVEAIGKTPVVLEREIPGFVANRLLGAVRDEALSLLSGGYAGVEAIDTAARTALGYPMGPFELMDLTGIDIGYYVKLGRLEETGNPDDAPSPLVTEKVERGELGQKSGIGWYRYDEQGKKVGVA